MSLLRAPFRSPAWNRPLSEGDFRALAGSSDRPPTPPPWPECRACGSTLTPGHRESEARRLIKGLAYQVETFRCGCGRGREVRRPT